MKNKNNLLFIFAYNLFLSVHLGESAKILFFFAGGTFSHKVSVWPFVTALADRGHNVTLISPFPKKPYEHSTVRDIAPQAMVELMGRQFANVDRLTQRLNHEEKNVWKNYHRDIIRLCQGIFDNVNTDPDLKQLFYNEKFDLMINNVVFGDCGYVLAHRYMQLYGTKLILYDSTYPVVWWPDNFGFPAETGWIPDAAEVKNFPMNFYDRVTNYFQPIIWHLSRQWELFPAIENQMKKVYNLDVVPSLVEVEKNASLLFVASHYSTDYGRSLPPFVVNIGGMQCWEKKKTNSLGEFQEFLDNAESGAILIAFGSTIDLSKIPDFFKTIFFEMMNQFPEIRFILRWGGTIPENLPKNIKMSKWLPQAEILGHKNLKGFISHAGLNSLTEATYFGVPVILLPLFADQDYNGYRVEAYELGIRLEARELTSKIMENSVREILQNKKYATNMRKMSDIMKDRPLNPIETAVWWTEFVLRHNDTSPLRPLGSMNLFQRRNLDIFFLAAFLMSLLSAIITLITCRIYSSQRKALLTSNAKHIKSSQIYNNKISNNNKNNSNQVLSKQKKNK